METSNSILILIAIMVIFYVFVLSKRNSPPAEGLTIPDSAGPLSKQEVRRLVKGGVPRSQDQYLMRVPPGSMAQLGSFTPDPLPEGFTVDSGVDVTSTDLQRQLFTGISAADGYTVKSDRYIVREKPNAYIVQKDGYVVKNQFAAQNASGPYRPRGD
jgi:hypothetical protein